jgi:DNA segregation ATPase FtsK/SpoIIIE-like protein
MATVSAKFFNPLAWIVRWLFPRRLTPAEKAEMEARRKLQKATEAKLDQLEREANHYADTISRTLANHGVASIEKIKGEREVRRYIRFLKWKYNEERIMFLVDTRPGKLPFGIGLDRIEDPEMIRLLAINCRHRVYALSGFHGGFWIAVDRVGGLGGLPTHVQFEEVMRMRPANARPLAIPLGVASGKDYPWKSFDRFNNMLIAGTIGSGKSRFLHSMICTLIRFNSDVRFVLVDLKGGVEFNSFWNLPHVLKIKWLRKKKKSRPVREPVEVDLSDDTPEQIEEVETLDELDEPEPDISQVPDVEEEDDGFEETDQERPAICERSEDVLPLLAWLRRECDRRLKILRNSDGKYKNIGQYNQSRSGYMHHIVVLIDEWADAKGGPGGVACEWALIKLIQRCRVAGIHVVVCTQTPKKEVLGQLVKNNLPVRVVFQCPDVYASQMLIGSQKAADITTPGRGYFVSGNQAMEIQTPYINDVTIEQYVKAAIEGRRIDPSDARHDVTQDEILKWAQEDNNGNLDYRSIVANFKERGLTQKEAQDICAVLEGKVFDIEGVRFKVEPGIGRYPRRLLRVDDAPTDSEVSPAISNIT